MGTAPATSKLVVVRFGGMTVHEDFAIVAMRWEATGQGGALFPALDADITLTNAPDDTAILAVWGVYRPPFGRPGEGLDQAVLRRVAQATIQNFTHRIGAAIRDPAASRGTRYRPAAGSPGMS
jgi:hypothetical protein